MREVHIIKKYFISILIIFFLVLLLLTGFREKYVQPDIKFTLLDSKEDIPPKIMEAIRNLELRNGAWQFRGDDYDGDGLYLVICHERDVGRGFEVLIENTYYLNGAKLSQKDVHMIGLYLFTEIHGLGMGAQNVEPLYSEGLKHPILVFKIDNTIIVEDNDNNKQTIYFDVKALIDDGNMYIGKNEYNELEYIMVEDIGANVFTDKSFLDIYNNYFSKEQIIEVEAVTNIPY